MKKSTKIISLIIIIISLFTCVKAEEECDAICELFWDTVSFMTGMLWRACMDTPECKIVAIPIVVGLVFIILIGSLVMRCISDKKYEFEGPNPRRVVAFGAGYICG
jgi:hypothetical protein